MNATVAAPNPQNCTATIGTAIDMTPLPGRAGPAANALQEPLAKSTARVSKASGTALSEGGAADEAGRRTSGLRQVASDDLAIPPCERAVREQPQAAQRQYIQQHFTWPLATALSEKEKEKRMVQSFPQRRRTARPLLSESGMRPVLRQAQQPGTASATAAAVLPSLGGQTLSPHVAAGPSRHPELELAPAWFRAVESAFLISVRPHG